MQSKRIPFNVQGNGWTMTTWNALPAYSVVTVVTKANKLFARRKTETFYTIPGYYPATVCPEEQKAVNAIVDARFNKTLVTYYAEAL
jgi:hypothetical protein